MFIIKLMGGLGNQMFQYAFARSLSIKYNKMLYLDLSFLEDKSYKKNFTHRDYELNIFNIQANFLTGSRLKLLNGCLKILRKFKLNYINQKIFQNKLPLLKYYSYAHTGYDMNSNQIKPCTYLEGYFQSEKYFKNIKNILQNDFTSKTKELSKNNQEIIQKIKNKNSVSIHIRRGDYVNNSHINNYHGLCSVDYYKKAIQYIKKQVKAF